MHLVESRTAVAVVAAAARRNANDENAQDIGTQNIGHQNMGSHTASHPHFAFPQVFLAVHSDGVHLHLRMIVLN